MDATQLNLGSGWKTYFYDQARAATWKLQTPQFKQCKKKKEFYTESFEGLWYKHPYKYDMVLRSSNIDDNVLAHIKLLYADTLDIVKPLNNKPTITKNENFFHPTHNEHEQEVHVGPFQFQVCSYKLDNRDVCLGVYLMLPPDHGSVESKVVCILVSPRFTIRSKKPVQQKNKRKRKAMEEEDVEEEDCEPVAKKPKLDDLPAELNLAELTAPIQMPLAAAPASLGFSDIITQHLENMDFQQMISFFQSSQAAQPEPVAQPQEFSPPLVPAFNSLSTTERKTRLAEIVTQCSHEELQFLAKKINEVEKPYAVLPSPMTPADSMPFFDMRPVADFINVTDYFKEEY